jgi:hypothetical protein
MKKLTSCFLAFFLLLTLLIPAAAAEKPKLGFPVPIRVWLRQQKYYDIVKDYDFTPTVYTDKDKETPLYTVYGEFAANKFEVENGAKDEQFGSLAMYYTDKDTEQQVYIEHEEAGGSSGRLYKYNSATSLFYISLLDGEKENQGSCTFATLKSGCVKVLEDLQADITAYIEANYTDSTDDEDDFTTVRSVRVNTDDPFVGENTINKSFHVPNAPIVIKKVEVKKF